MVFRLLQQRTEHGSRQVLFAKGATACVVNQVRSIRELAWRAIEAGCGLHEAVDACRVGGELDLAAGLEAGALLAPIDHDDPSQVFLIVRG